MVDCTKVAENEGGKREKSKRKSEFSDFSLNLDGTEDLSTKLIKYFASLNENTIKKKVLKLEL